MDRRSFCYLGLMGLMALSLSCEPNEEDAAKAPDEKEPRQEKEMAGKQEHTHEPKGGRPDKMSHVAVVATTSREEGVRKSLELLAHLDVKEKNVLLKPNFNTADPMPGSTHNDTLRALLRELRQRGTSGITIGERSGPPLPTEEVMKKKGVFELAQEEGAKILNFDKLKEEEFYHFRGEDLHWKDGFLIPQAVREAEAVVSTCCLKTHAFGGVFTLALKLAVGMVPKRAVFDHMSELHGSPHIRKMIAEINLAFQPVVTVLDGVEAFVDGGPATGKRKRGDLFLASSDRVALDAAGVAALKHLGSNPPIMETPIFEQEQIAHAGKIGLGATSPGEIELIPADDEKSRSLAERLRQILDRG